MNIVVIQGRMVKEADMKMTPNGKKVAKFRIAVPRDKETADFIDCAAWEKKAEFVERYFGKGKPITVIGQVRTNVWQTEDGSKRKDVYIHCTDVQFAFGVPKDSEDAPVTSPYQTSVTLEEVEPGEELPF